MPEAASLSAENNDTTTPPILGTLQEAIVLWNTIHNGVLAGENSPKARQHAQFFAERAALSFLHVTLPAPGPDA